MSQPTDNEILRRMSNGDSGALGLLYMRYAATVNDFAFRFIRDKQDADDITHNIFCKLWEQREEITDINSLKSYLFKMTRNAIFKVFRHRRIVDQYQAEVLANELPPLTDGESAINTADLIEMIDLSIQNMPELRRKIFCMSRYDNMTYAEIAAKLDISPKTVQYHIGVALAELRKLIQILVLFI